MLEDAQLFAEAQGGSTTAFAELVRRHEAHVGAVVIARMRQATHVDDVLQETFVAAWTRRESLREPEKFRSWVCGIARNQAAKVHRRESRTTPSLLPSAPESAEARLLQNESEQALRRAMEALPEKDREVLVLFYREDQSIREIAIALGLSDGAAQKRISRARDSVKAGVRSILSDALPASRAAKGVSAAVLASITTATYATTANAATQTSPSTSAAITKGSSMKIVATLTSLAAFAGGGAIYAHLSDGESAQAAKPKTAAATQARSSTQPVSPPSADKGVRAKLASAIEMRRISRSERAKRLALHKAAATSSAPTAAKRGRPSLPNPQSGDRDIIKSTVAAVEPLITECYELAQISNPTLEGMVALRFHISDEAEIAGLVTKAEVSRRKGRFNPPNPDFEECMEETMMSLEFVGMSKGLTVTYPFVFRLQDDAPRAPSLTTAELRSIINKSDDPDQLVNLAEEFSKTKPEISAQACERAIGLAPTLRHAFSCTLEACRSGQEQQALAYWTIAAKTPFGESLASLATKACAETHINLPKP